MKKGSVFEEIPGVGKSIARDLEQLGYKKVSDLKSEDPEKLKWWFWKDAK